MEKNDITAKIPISVFDRKPSNMSAFYFYNGLLDSEKLKVSLIKTLKDIPVLSSRIKEIDQVKYFLHTDPGDVELITKEVDNEEIFEACRPNKEGLISAMHLSDLYKHLQPVNKPQYPIKPLDNYPVLKVTLLLLKNLRKSILCVTLNQAVADRYSLMMFMHHWCADGTRDIKQFNYNRKELEPATNFDESKVPEELLEKLSVYHPLWEVPKSETVYDFLNPDECIQKVLHFSPQNISQLKRNIKVGKGTDLLDYNYIYAHLWKLHAFLRVEFKDETYVPLLIDLDFRDRVENLGKNYFGNASLYITMKKKKKDLINAEFSEIVVIIQKVLGSVNSETIKTAAGFMKKYPGIALWTNQSLIIGNLKMHDIYKLNFGSLKCDRYIIPTYSSRQLWLVNDAEDKRIDVKMTFKKNQWKLIEHLDLTAPEVFSEIRLLQDTENNLGRQIPSRTEHTSTHTSNKKTIFKVKFPNTECGISRGIEAS